MAEDSPTHASEGQPIDDPMRRAFGLLASAELGEWPNHIDDLPPEYLDSRVEILAELLDVVPRAGMKHLPKVIDAWCDAFPAAQVVSCNQLREIARTALVTEAKPAPSSQDAGLRRALALVELPESTALQPQRQATSIANETEAYRHCAFGLGVWFDQLDTDRWTQLAASIPGENALDIEKVYVELYAITDNDSELDSQRPDAPKRLARQLLSNQYPVVDVSTMLARTLHRCVVIGEPGAGKSTMVRWLTWAVHRGKCSDFKTSLVVKLGAFAQELAENPEISVIEFFFQSLGTRIDDWRDASEALRRIASEKHRFLLLLDGWDEVPPGQRDLVREKITAEQDFFVTVITSRTSGLPRQFRDGDRVEVYRIAGLAEPSRDDLIRKLLAVHGHSELFEAVLHRIETEPDLREMAANPFLLGLLVRVLSRTNGSNAPLRTLADVYQQVADWVRDQHNLNQPEHAALTAEHFTGLRQLSHSLLFGPELPRYLFRKQELQEVLPKISAEPVFRSRFVNRTDPVFDEYAFLHATFQEFFAASHADKLDLKELQHFLDHAFRSSSRLIVLEFLAGQHGQASARCRERVAHWIQERDRFQQVMLKAARLATAGRWQESGSSGLIAEVQSELWQEIAANKDMRLTRLAVEALAELEPVKLSRQARAATGLDNWVIQCIIEALPQSIRRQEKLDDLLWGEWRDYAGLDARGGATESDRSSVRATLVNKDATEEALRVAIVHAGVSKDTGAVASLLRLLSADNTDPDLKETIIDTLGVIAGREAIDALIDVVFGKVKVSEDGVRIAIGVLRHSGHNKKALDPVGRDRLLRRLAVLPPDSAELEPILRALEGSPIREGATILGQIAIRKQAPVSVRVAAILAMTGAIERSLLEQTIGTITEEASGEVVDTLLLLSVVRSVPAPRGWLETLIVKTHDKNKLRKLLPAYLLPLAHAHGAERIAAHLFLNQQLSEALTQSSEKDDSRISAWEQALSQSRLTSESIAADTFQQALDSVVRFTALPPSVSAAQIRLAICILGRFRKMVVRNALREALTVSLEFPASEPTGLEKVSQAIANSLAEIAPGELLHYPSDCECVNTVLRTRAVQRGWLVYRNRILDAEGDEIASIHAADPIVPHSDSADLKAIAGRLPEANRLVFLAYWWMVRDGGPCDPGDTFRRIYDTSESLWKSGEGVDANYLKSLYPDLLPSYEAWKKAINRIQKQFESEPEILAQLHRIGLQPRRKR